MDVALVNMPWSPAMLASISLGILKTALKKENFSAKVFYFNLYFAEKIGVNLYDSIGQPFPLGEWLFSRIMFGPRGTKEINATEKEFIEQMHNRLDCRFYMKNLKPLCGHRDWESSAKYLSESLIPELIEKCLDDLIACKSNIFAFTCTFSQTCASLYMAHRLKKVKPDCKVIFGGPGCTSPMGEELFRSFDVIDYIVDGEGELVFPKIIKKILNNKKFELKSVRYRSKNKIVENTDIPQPINLEKYSIEPDYKDYFECLNNNGFNRQFDPLIPFEGSRGCWKGQKQQCAFCGLNDKRICYRPKSPQALADEIESISKKYKTVHLHASDSVLDQARLDEITEKIVNKNLDITIYYNVTANLNRKQVFKLRDCGIRAIQPGIESLNADILRKISKGTTVIQCIHLLKSCLEAQITAIWNIIYALPNDKTEDYKKIINVMQQIQHLEPASSVIPFFLLRFSPFYDFKEKYNITNVKPHTLYKYIFPHNRINFEKIAYYFEYDNNEISPRENAREYLSDLETCHEQWQNNFSSKTIKCYFYKGPEFVVIFDNRPFDINTKPPYDLNRYELTGQVAELYQYCSDKPRYFDDIVTHLSRNYSTNKLFIKMSLNNLVDKNLIYREQNKYLSLAIPAKYEAIT